MVASVTRLAGSAHAGPIVLAFLPEGGGILGRTADGACVFFDVAGGRLCAVHRELGESALPGACRQFPRVTLTDPRGRWITLSHFCPTAAALLFSPDPVTIVPAPDALSLHGAAEGLDATAALPPLLKPGLLMDLDGYGAWERGAIDILCTRGRTVDAALSGLRTAAGAIQQWSPGRDPLDVWVDRTFDELRFDDERRQLSDDREDYARVLSSVPEGLPVPFSPPHRGDGTGVETVWNAYDAVIRRYLSAKVFGCWWPYLGLDLGGVLSAVQLHASVLRVRLGARIAQGDRDRTALLEAIREADLLMVHLADGSTVAKRMTRVL